MGTGDCQDTVHTSENKIGFHAAKDRERAEGNRMPAACPGSSSGLRAKSAHIYESSESQWGYLKLNYLEKV